MDYFKKLTQKIDADARGTLKGSFMILLLKCIGAGIQFLQTFLVVRLFGLEANGILALFVSLIKGFGLISVFGLDNLTMREVATLSGDNELQKKIKEWGLVYLFSAVITVLGAIFIFSGVYLTSSLDTLWWLVCITLVPMTFLKIFSFYSRGILKLIRFAFVEFAGLNGLFLLLLGLWYWVFDFGSMNGSLLIKLFAVGAFLLAGYFTIVLLKSDLDFTLKNLYKTSRVYYAQSSLSERIKGLLGRSYHFLFINGTTVITATVISVIISSQLSSKGMGIYDAVLRVSQLAVIPLMGINGALGPKISTYFHNAQLKKMRKQVYIFTLLAAGATAMISGILILFFDPLFGFIDPALQAYFKLFCLLIIAQILNVVTGPVGFILQMTHEEKVFNKIVIISSILYLGSTYLFIGYIGLNIVGYAYILFISFTNFTASYFVYKKFRFFPAMVFLKVFDYARK